MKKVSAVFILIILLILVYTIFIHKGLDLKRINISSKKFHNPEECKEFSILPFKVNNTSYFASKGKTFPGRLVNLSNDIQVLDINPHLNGNFSIYFTISNTSLRSVHIQIFQKERCLLDKGINKGEEFLFSQDIILSKNDKINIKLKGKGKIILTNPIFYKKTPPSKREYVFLICADTLRADHLPVYGYHRQTSPNIDKFVKESVLFENPYAQGTWTLPSHMSLFTALYEWNHAVRKDTMIPDNIDYLVEELSEKFVTKSFNGGIYISSRFGFFRGFDYYASIDNDQFSTDSSEQLFKLAIKDIEDNNFFRTFYFLHTYQVHSPYQPPKKHLYAFNKSIKHKSLTAPTVPTNHKDQFKKYSEDMVQNYIDLYDAEILTFDEWFGFFLNYLKKQNIYDNSMIILMSDHGEEFYDHQGWGHTHSLYNEIIKVPLIIKFPKNKFKNTMIKSVVGLIDIMPTILSYYNIKYNKTDLDGINLVPLIRGRDQREDILSSLTCGFYIKELPFKLSRIQNDNFKIIYNLEYNKKTFDFFNTPPPPYKKYQYFNLNTDPEEKFNLYLKKIAEVEKYKLLFNQIIRKVYLQLQKKLQKVNMDYKTRQKFKSLGYIN